MKKRTGLDHFLKKVKWNRNSHPPTFPLFAMTVVTPPLQWQSAYVNLTWSILKPSVNVRMPFGGKFRYYPIKVI